MKLVSKLACIIHFNIDNYLLNNKQMKFMENNSQNLMGKWGWVSIDEIKSENFKKYLDPQTAKIITSFNFSDFVFKCIEIGEDNFLKLKSSETELVLKKEVFRLMPTEPKFKPLEKVNFYNSKNILEFGTIKNINWHNNDNKHIYLIEVNGKMKTQRYYDKDLEISE